MGSEDNSYRHFSLAPGEIRILELHPADSADANLSCRLTTQLITGEPYDALSYVWGKPTVYQSSIWCADEIDSSDAGNEGALRIGANLATALLAYRLPDRPRRIWVDAICIQQDDTDERLSQVRMMGDIFHNATQVLCWLGAFQDPTPDKTRALAAIDFIQQFNKDPTRTMDRTRAIVHRADEHKAQVPPDVAADEAVFMRSWHAIKAFFDCEYFHRAWIIQEIGLARRAWLSWGHKDVCVDWRDVAAFVLFLDDNGASVIGALGLQSWVANHINLVWSRREDGVTPLYDFCEVLHWARVHRSTDPRDYVYSLLGHPSAVVEGSLLVQPLYTLPTVEVYTNLAVNVIEKSSSLQVLAFVDHGEEPNALGLPTWVPDWHALNLVAPLKCPTSAAPPRFKGITMDLTGPKPALFCRGSVIGIIRAVSDMINHKELVITDLETEKRKQQPFLVDHLFSTLILTHPAQTRPNTRQFIAALSFVLTGAYRGTVPAASGAARQQQEQDLATHILKGESFRHQASEAPGAFSGSLSSDDFRLLLRLGRDGDEDQMVQDMTWTSMCRRAFIMASGHIGLGPRTMAAGDVVAVLPGSKYPLVLRKVNVEQNGYELVGPALVYGFMDQEVARAPKGTYTEEKFCII